MAVGYLLPSQEKYIFTLASIGDCKIYHYKKEENLFFDLTFDNRDISLDPSDPGGRLGPFGADGEPDLRNLDLYSTICEKGDLIICVSDGIHDNLDPELLGILPKDIKIEFDSWSEIPSQVACSLKSKFALRLLKSLLLKDEKRNFKLTPKHCVNVLIHHAQNVTKSTRDWVFVNPQAKLPTNYRKLPGKLDHTTCVTFEVGGNFYDQSHHFLNLQEKMNSLHSNSDQILLAEYERLQREYFSLNVPLQVTLAYTDTHVKLFCRTLTQGEFKIDVHENHVFIKLVNCTPLVDMIGKIEFHSLTFIEGDELSFPIERSITLPFPVIYEDPSATEITYLKESKLLKISIKRKFPVQYDETNSHSITL